MCLRVGLARKRELRACMQGVCVCAVQRMTCVSSSDIWLVCVCIAPLLQYSYCVLS